MVAEEYPNTHDGSYQACECHHELEGWCQNKRPWKLEGVDARANASPGLGKRLKWWNQPWRLIAGAPKWWEILIQSALAE